jgi:ribosomal protein S18 acetylase RimI-like enzyme
MSMPKTPVTIRTATLDDAEFLLELGSTTFYAAYSDNIPSYVLNRYVEGAFTLDNLQAELKDPDIRFFVAEAEDIPVGYATLNWNAPPQSIRADNPVELQRIYVRQDWIGEGVGAALMRASLEAATERACDVIWLGVWEENHRAQLFYRKWGFAVVGQQSFQLGHLTQTDLLLQRNLDAN